MQRYLDRRLKLRHLRVIKAVSENPSFVKAAKSLCITQPALTRSLQEIEDILGVRLFERNAKGVTENQFGHILSKSANRILSELDRVEEEMNQLLFDVSGTVVVGALPVAAAGILPGALARLHATHKDLQIRLVQGRTAELLPLLNLGSLDLILGQLYEPEQPDDLVREPLYAEPICILAHAGHPIFDEPDKVLRSLATYDMVLPTSALVAREIDDLLALLELERRPALRSSSIGFIREMVLSTEFITVMPRLMMTGDHLRGTVRSLPLPAQAPARPGGLIYRPDRTIVPGAKALIETIRTYVEEVSSQEAEACAADAGPANDPQRAPAIASVF